MQFHEHPEWKIPQALDDATSIGAFAAKGCYDSYGEDGRSCEENQRGIIESKHGSVLEHIHIGMSIAGITRGLTLELNRHRTFNISQRSTRYAAEEDAAFVLEPYFAMLWMKYNMTWNEERKMVTQKKSRKKIELSHQAFREIAVVRDHVQAMAHSQCEYEKQVEALEDLNPLELDGFDLRKWARGKARNVLSHGLETRGVWTNNLRGWRWVIEQRSSRYAEPEIRRLSNFVMKRLFEEAPLYFDDFHVIAVVDGIPEWKPVHSKV